MPVMKLPAAWTAASQPPAVAMPIWRGAKKDSSLVNWYGLVIVRIKSTAWMYDCSQKLKALLSLFSLISRLIISRRYIWSIRIKKIKWLVVTDGLVGTVQLLQKMSYCFEALGNHRQALKEKSRTFSLLLLLLFLLSLVLFLWPNVMVPWDV